jgi:flagellar motor switch protein FliN/FliY
VTTDQALLKIAAVTAQAVTDVLRTFCGPQVTPGPAKIAADDEHALSDIVLPAVVTRVAYLDGAAGGALLALPVGVARQVAAAMMGADPPQDEAIELTEIEQSALSEALEEITTAAAEAVGAQPHLVLAAQQGAAPGACRQAPEAPDIDVGALLGATIAIGPPETRLVTSTAQGAEPIADPGDHAAHVDVSVLDTPCRLVQLVPDAFVTRVTDALDDTLVQHDSQPLKAALCDIPVRVWVELGRASMPLGRLVALPPGEVVDLDRDVDDPVDLYVDGMHVARGRLAVSESGEFLTLQIESLTRAHAALAA